MNKKYFTLTISQSVTDPCDYAIHFKEKHNREELLAHIRFSNSQTLDAKQFDSIISNLTKELANNIIEKRVLNETIDENHPSFFQANEIVQELIKKMQQH